MNKRGFVVTGTKKWIGLLIAVVFFLLSVYVMATFFGMNLPFGFLDFFLNELVLAWIVLAGSIYLIFDSITELGHKRLRSLLAALIGLILGLVPVLHSFNVIPFTIPFGVVVYALSMIILGGFLIWDFTGG
ncbi:hypothetical protein KY312_03690 [Candidatus Woesearchaeota archaeon]|nr:hypothetical protein [Candidatus Woesearchaeota archaeon]